ncbi:MAG TPA: TfoX/Sxy family protein [Anaeromyxobacter sp.]|nr:TfoX/Sxy family protein [Anaeromyxobacter sp.]
MPCSPTFADHAVDLLSGLGPVDARRMFGGYGVYARGVMFALLYDDELFLKTDDETRDRFRAAGCRMWVYGRMAETNYYRPPDEAHEDAEAMLPWAKLGLEAALRRRAAKAAKAAEKERRRAARGKGSKGPARKPATSQAKRTPRSRPRAPTR